MITAITESNKSKFRELFAEASDILSGYKRVRTYDKEYAETYYRKDPVNGEFVLLDPINSLTEFTPILKEWDILYVPTKEGPVDGYEPNAGITTLEEYFSWLKTLGAINRKYTVLPCQEQYFDINANTRGINIPVDFKKNGVAVQSDDLAEVLYFRIDRYFDYMDLNNTDIFIQWETPKGPDGKTIKSVSPAYVRDLESEPGKMIFGWAISDLITAYAGQLKFSVRFYQWENPELAEQEGAEKVLAYSFSTLTATVDIKPSINLDIEKDEYIVDDCGDRLVERLENSVIVGGYVAATPKFDDDIEEKAGGYDLDKESGEYKLTVLAMASDTGAINYTWKRQELNSDNTVANAAITPVDSKYVQNVFDVVDNDSLDSDEAKQYTYYKKTLSGESYTLYTGNIPPRDEDEWSGIPDRELYIKKSTCTVDNYGEYWAVAENRITNSVTSALSKRAKFPRPEFVTITTEPAEKAILELVEDNGEQVFSTTLSVAAIKKDNGNFTYQWYKSAGEDDYKFDFDAENADFIALEGETTPSLKVIDEQGRYKVAIVNTRNKNSTEPTYSIISRVTYDAALPTLEWPVDMDFIKADFDSNRSFEIGIDSEGLDYDQLTVEWYKHGEKEPKLIFTDPLSVGVFTSYFNPLDHIEPDENGEIDFVGRYYPVVINEFNGSVKRTDKITDPDAMFVVTEE